VNIELINTGTELILGRTLNTHQQWLCRRLGDLGWTVTRQVTVADAGTAIEAAVREALQHADLVITTGGLGPTADDITRERIAALLDRPLREDAETLAHVQRFYAQRRRVMPDRVKIQALVPEGALVLPNVHGTAPGLALEIKPNPFRSTGNTSWLIMLPGPPRELRPMFDDEVVPLLRRVLAPPQEFACTNLRTTGLPESIIEQRIAKSLGKLVEDGLKLGYCARLGQVDIRLEARGNGAAALTSQAETIVRLRIGSNIFGTGDEELESVIVRLLTERKQTLALAESCTGGAIANRITNVPGASVVLLAGFVTYSNTAKKKSLGVREATVTAHGAVSEPVAREMAEGARRQTGADFAISVTGIAGPTGGSAEKPVGTVFIGLASTAQTAVEHKFNAYDRETFKSVTTNQALELLWRRLLASEHPKPKLSE